tara:strand:- start:300 stop:491 length:192 start_codon:yes stop_codon:yes gene_type:complete
MNYITVLDFEVGKVFQYKIGKIDETACDYERFLNDNGHNLSNCEWMVHDNNELITNYMQVVTN